MLGALVFWLGIVVWTPRPALVEPAVLEPTIHLDVRYATTDNFVRRRVYRQARVFLARPAARALIAAHRALRAHGLGLVVHDGYRPWRVTKLFWDLSPPAQRAFVADPRAGSKHNRGCAVDVSLYDLATGAPVPMPSGYDEMSERAHPAYAGGADAARAARDLLRRTMEAHGFTVEPNEWWHYNYAGWENYPVLDVPFEEL